MTTIDKCRKFYTESVAPVIHEKYPDFECRIAAGIAGEGSECWGYDDIYSQDHDYSDSSICLWLTDEDYEEIGANLEEDYAAIISWPAGGTRLDYRRGILRTSDFYRRILGFTIDPENPVLTDSQWFHTEDWRLAAAVNGEVFRDDLGEFTKVRKVLEGHYPDQIFRMKLANSLHEYAASLQANYPRCMARRDYVAAHRCIDIGLTAAMQIVFLLENKYMPYYKWSFRALNETASHNGQNAAVIAALASLLESIAVAPIRPEAWAGHEYSSSFINMSDEIVRLSEAAAGIIVELMLTRGITSIRETFLEAHCAEVSGRL